MCRITCKIMVNTPVGLIRSFSQNLSGKKRVTQSIWNIVLCVEMGNSRRLDTTIVFWHRLLRRRMQDGPAARYDFETEIWMKCNNLSRFESAPNQAGLDCGQSCFLLCEQWIILRHGAWLFTWLRLFLGQLAFGESLKGMMQLVWGSAQGRSLQSVSRAGSSMFYGARASQKCWNRMHAALPDFNILHSV